MSTTSRWTATVLATCAIAAKAHGAVWLPVISGEQRIDTNGVSFQNPEDSTMVRVGDMLYITYRDGDLLTYVRGLDLTDFALADHPHAISTTGLGAPIDQAYHYDPSIFRNDDGELLVFNSFVNMETTYEGTWTFPPQLIVAPDLEDSGTWSTPAGTPSRVENVDVNTHGIYNGDLMGVYDPETGETHIVSECAFYNTNGPGIVPGGIQRCYTRVDQAGVIDGPYVLVQAPRAEADLDCEGNVFTKGDIVLGRECSGAHSLHLFWSIRHTFPTYCGSSEEDYTCEDVDWNICPPENGVQVPSCSKEECDSGHTVWHQWNYNVYYARSNDGGLHWSNYAGTATVNVSSNGGAIGGIAWNDADFVIYEGDVEQSTERAVDVDPDNNPVVALMAHEPGTGSDLWHHVDNDVNVSEAPVYHLKLLRRVASDWEVSDIDTITDYRHGRPKLKVDDDGRIWVFNEDWYLGDGRPVYNVSPDNGAMWSGWISFGDVLGDSRRLRHYPDPLNTNLEHIGWTDDDGSHWTSRYAQFRMTCNANAYDADCSTNGIADACEPDCNTNGNPDSCDIAYGTSVDTNTDGWPDDCVPICDNADINCDGYVNGSDQVNLSAPGNFGRNPLLAVYPRDDINRDGIISGSDTISLHAPGTWGTSTGPCYCPPFPFGKPYPYGH